MMIVIKHGKEIAVELGRENDNGMMIAEEITEIAEDTMKMSLEDEERMTGHEQEAGTETVAGLDRLLLHLVETVDGVNSENLVMMKIGRGQGHLGDQAWLSRQMEMEVEEVDLYRVN